MEVKNHILYDNGQPVAYKQTPNLSSGTKDIRFIVLHYDGANNETSAVNWMTNKDSKVSSDLHISKSGKITQLAPFNKITWHVGASAWKGLTGLNKYSIGIEQQNPNARAEWTELQIKTVIDVCKALVRAYPSITEILAHSEVATPKGRKDDPGPKFPMDRVRKEVFGSNNQEGKLDSKRTTADLNLRQGAGTNFSVLEVLKSGSGVLVLSEKDNWSEIVVCSSKRKGFVSSKYLK